MEGKSSGFFAGPGGVGLAVDSGRIRPRRLLKARGTVRSGGLEHVGHIGDCSHAPATQSSRLKVETQGPTPPTSIVKGSVARFIATQAHDRICYQTANKRAAGDTVARQSERD